MVTHAIGSENKPCIHNLLLAVVVVAEYVYILMVNTNIVSNIAV